MRFFRKMLSLSLEKKMGLCFIASIFGGGISLILQSFLSLCACVFAFVLSSIFLAILKKGIGYKIYFIPMALFAVFLSFNCFKDIPAYVTHKYLVAEGIPSEYHFEHSSKGGVFVVAKIQNKEFSFPITTPTDRWLVVQYHPNSKWILSYKVLSWAETTEELKKRGLK